MARSKPSALVTGARTDRILGWRPKVTLAAASSSINSAMISKDFAGNVGVEIKYALLLTKVAGLLISPLLLAIAILIKLDSPGLAFYGHRVSAYEARDLRFVAGQRKKRHYADRVKLDASYVHNWLVSLDLVILAGTVRGVIFGRGAY